MKTIKETILEKIEKDKLTMRPRFYFVLKVILLALLGLAILFISVFIFNFILFSIRLNSEDELLGFGPRGIAAFMRFFPWIWFLLDVILITFLQTLVRKFKFGYRVPVIYLICGIFAAALLLGFAFDRGTDVNDRIMRRVDQHRLPPSVEGFYRGARRPVPPKGGICKCTVIDLFGDKMIVADNRFGTTTLFTVIFPRDNPHATSTLLQKGDTIFIAGDLENDIIHAYGIKKINKNNP